MKLGAQLYSLRTNCETPNDLLNTMKKVKAIGYEVAQASGICQIDGELLRSYAEETELPITCTHRSFDEIVNHTEESIKWHKTIGSPIVGIGSMPTEFHGSYEGLKKFKEVMAEPVKKIRDAGLRFTYHNHAFEFETWDGVLPYDYLIEELPEFDFIHDVYWTTYAGECPEKYIKLLAEAGRMTDIHFKDMKSAPKGPICACGDGVIDFAPLAKLCASLGIKNVLVEQDNAPEFDDPFEQMQRSYNHLEKMIKSEV